MVKASASSDRLVLHFLLPIWWNDCRGLKGPSHILFHVNEGHCIETNPLRRKCYLPKSCHLPQEAPFLATGHCLLLLWKSIFCCCAENHFWKIGIFSGGKSISSPERSDSWTVVFTIYVAVGRTLYKFVCSPEGWLCIFCICMDKEKRWLDEHHQTNSAEDHYIIIWWSTYCHQMMLIIRGPPGLKKFYFSPISNRGMSLISTAKIMQRLFREEEKILS